MNVKFKVRFIHLMPILLSLMFGIGCAFLLLSSSMEVYVVTPFQEGVGSFGNAFYFVVLVGVGASLLYLLLKRKDNRLISLITGFALVAAVFMLSIIYLLAIFSIFAIPNIETVIFVSSIFMTILSYFAIFLSSSKVCNLAVLCLGGALGAFLGFSIPALSAVLILCSLAVYDAFAVYYGPVGKIARSGLDKLRGLSFSFKDVQMGLGDLTFYSMLSGLMLLSLGVISCLASVMGILVGCLLAFKMLEKKGMFPGLPFPIVLGLAAGFLASLL